jgi:glutathione peroxidase
MRSIAQILNDSKTIAIVGLSNKPDRASNEVAAYLQQNGYRIVPVNPSYAGQTILGEQVYATLQEAADALASNGQRIDIVDCFRKSEDIPPIARDAIAVRAGCLWMQLRRRVFAWRWLRYNRGIPTRGYPAMIKTTALLFAALAAASAASPAAAQATSAPGAPAAARMPMSCPAILKQNFKRLQDDAPQDLCQYAGKVVLVVNTASYCGFTKQYEGLEKLYAKYGGRGLVVLGFPSNDFGKQEPGNAKEIADFCFNTYGVKFPMFAKSSVTGPEANPLHASLTKATGQAPKWNFTKYLIGRDGKVLEYFPSKVTPEDPALVGKIEQALTM